MNIGNKTNKTQNMENSINDAREADTNKIQDEENSISDAQEIKTNMTQNEENSINDAQEADMNKTQDEENSINDLQEAGEEKRDEKYPGQLAYEKVHMEQSVQKAGFFSILYLPSLLYAVIYTICMFKNSSGITMPVWIASTITYACFVLKKLEEISDWQEDAAVLASQDAGSRKLSADKMKAGSRIYIGIMMLLGISTFMTDNFNTIVLNYFGFFIVLIAFLLHNVYDDSRWEFGKHMLEIAVSVFGAISCMLAPFLDGIAYFQNRKKNDQHTLMAVFIGFICAVPLLTVLGALLMDADAVFGNMVFQILSGFRIPAYLMHGIAMLLFGFFSSYCGMRYLARHSRNDGAAEHRKYNPVTALTFTGLITVMYVLFCMIQIIYLFVGNMQLPEGMTYAEYAHNGFFQLLFVCIVNLCLVLLVQKYFTQHKALDGMLLAVCACTYIMIASSAYRMLLYIRTYQLTFLRVLVLIVLGTLALLLGGVIILILKPGFRLFRYSMIVVSVVYLFFSFSHVDYFIASYNLSQADENMDWWYLSGMSMDAAPAIADYYENAPMEIRSKMDAYASWLLMNKGGRKASLRLTAGEDGEIYGDDVMEAHESWDYEVQQKVDWYGIYLSKVFDVRENMGIRNFNLSRFLASWLLLS